MLLRFFCMRVIVRCSIPNTHHSYKSHISGTHNKPYEPNCNFIGIKIAWFHPTFYPDRMSVQKAGDKSFIANMCVFARAFSLVLFLLFDSHIVVVILFPKLRSHQARKQLGWALPAEAVSAEHMNGGRKTITNQSIAIDKCSPQPTKPHDMHSSLSFCSIFLLRALSIFLWPSAFAWFGWIKWGG